ATTPSSSAQHHFQKLTYNQLPFMFRTQDLVFSGTLYVDMVSERVPVPSGPFSSAEGESILGHPAQQPLRLGSSDLEQLSRAVGGQVLGDLVDGFTNLRRATLAS
ncbi:hypothetical protein, partial [Streptomyces sp. NPDC048386]